MSEDPFSRTVLDGWMRSVDGGIPNDEKGSEVTLLPPSKLKSKSRPPPFMSRSRILLMSSPESEGISKPVPIPLLPFALKDGRMDESEGMMLERSVAIDMFETTPVVGDID